LFRQFQNSEFIDSECGIESANLEARTEPERLKDVLKR
jgi:hypothetical protein